MCYLLNLCGIHLSFYLNKAPGANNKEIIDFSFSAIIGFVFLFLFSSNVISANQNIHTQDKYDKERAFEFSQAALNRTISNYKFVNTDNKPIELMQYRGKPLIISLIYTSCHHVCPTLTSYLAGVVKIAQEALGKDSFSVITVGFDTEADSPQRMHLFARERNINLSGWDFLSTDKDTIEAFSNELGFIFFKSPKGFDHLSQITLLDAEGKVYRQIYGVKYDPPHLVEPLKELVFGNYTESNTVSSWINNIRLFCTVYDPLSGRYEFDYSIFIGIAISILTLGAMALFVVREWRRTKNSGVT